MTHAYPASPSALRGQRVTVFGLGTKGGGTEVVKWLSERGAQVLVTDAKTEGELKTSLEALRGLPVRYVLGGHHAEDFRDADLIIRNPAVPLESSWLQLAVSSGVPVVMDTTLFFLFCPAPIAGITGTRGKSTATAVAGEILRRGRQETVVAGNIQRSPLADLDRITADTPVVLELSSWQLEGIEPLARSPHWAVLTTILPDHLNRYASMDTYVAAKETIVKYQHPGDLAILPSDDPQAARFTSATPAAIRWFGKPVDRERREGLFLIGDEVVLRRSGREELLLAWRDLGVTGDHTKRNLLAGALLAIEMGAPLEDVRSVLHSFRGLPNRLEFVGEYAGRTFVNDTTATTPEAVIAALQSFPGRRIVLLTGGTDKNLDYRSLASVIARSENLRGVVLFAGSATEKILSVFGIQQAATSGSSESESRRLNPEVPDPVRTMGDAVARAISLSRPGDLILLSPGAASFELFRDEFDRGEQFRDAVSRLRP